MRDHASVEKGGVHCGLEKALPAAPWAQGEAWVMVADRRAEPMLLGRFAFRCCDNMSEEDDTEFL